MEATVPKTTIKTVVECFLLWRNAPLRISHQIDQDHQLSIITYVYFLVFSSTLILWLGKSDISVLSWTPLVSPKYVIYIRKRDDEQPRLFNMRFPPPDGQLVFGHISSARLTTRPPYVPIHLLLAGITIYTVLILNQCMSVSYVRPHKLQSCSLSSVQITFVFLLPRLSLPLHKHGSCV